MHPSPLPNPPSPAPAPSSAPPAVGPCRDNAATTSLVPTPPTALRPIIRSCLACDAAHRVVEEGVELDDANALQKVRR